MQTFTSLANYGLRASTDFAIYYPKDDPAYYIQTIWSICFFLIVNCVLMNIIFGLIISGFGKNREDLNNLQLDIQQKCFICGINRYEFDMK